MVALAAQLQKKTPWKAVKCWFVTKEEPTADQRTVAIQHKHLVNAVSYSQFQAKIIDARTYLALRDKYPFGSVRDPETGGITPAVDYIPLDLIEMGTNSLWSPKYVCDKLLDAGKFVIMGDYGAGKSMTLRNLYQELRKQYLRNQTHLFPVFINLRDHFGQTNASEILERHARLIGFPNPSHVVRAWRAGYVVLLIDGIDEITTTGIQGLWKKLQDTRYRATQGIRELVRDHPDPIGIALAGRAHFFDSERERVKALGLSNAFHQLSLNEFTDEQIKKYLERSGLAGHIPSWLPSRPLLIGYLASRKMLNDIVSGEPLGSGRNIKFFSPTQGWDHLLNKICDRESMIEAGIDGETVRKILERLATVARSSQDGLGPLTPDQIVDGFKQICGYAPDEKGMLLLQRLPGLGIDRSDEQTRKFVDEAFADVCRSGDVCSYIIHPYDYEISIFDNAECGMGELGVGVAGEKLVANNITESKANASLDYAHKNSAPPILVLDSSLIMIQNDWMVSNPTTVTGRFIPSLTLDEDTPNVSKLTFRDCYFSHMNLADDLVRVNLPHFASCYVGELEGRLSIQDIPTGMFDSDCTIDSFLGSGKTTKALIGSDLPLGVKVLLTILKKLYQQSGSGRKEKALVSGLDHHARRLVADVLKIAQSESLAIAYKRGKLSLWLPNRNLIARAAKIISAPTECGDISVKKCKDIE